MAKQKVDLYAHHGALIQEGAVWYNGEATLQVHDILNHTGDVVSVQNVALTVGSILTTSANGVLF
ncbi:hypothetical protein V4B17_01065 [Bartonella sp. B23]